MIIYDYQNQNLIDFKQLIVALFLILFGLFCFFILSKYKPDAKEDFSTRLLGLTKSQIANKISEFPKISKMMGIMVFIISGFLIYTQMKDYYYVRNISHFENIKTISGRIDSVSMSNLFGTDYVTLHLNDKSFCIAHDSKYVAYRNLLKDDSVRIEYFESNRDKLIDFEVVKIELK